MPNESPKAGCIKLPIDYYKIIHSQDDLIDQIFPHVRRQYTNREWLAERAAKNLDVNELNLKIQRLLAGDLVS